MDLRPAGAVPGLLPGAGRPTGAGPAHRRVATVPGAPAALALLPVLAAGRRQADDPVRADDLQPSADGLVRPDRRSRPGRPGEARLRLRHAARRHAPAADVQPDPLRLLAQRQQPVAGGGARGAGGLRRGEPGAGGVLAAGTQVQPVADRRPRRPRRRGEPAVVRLQLLPRHCGKPPEPPPARRGAVDPGGRRDHRLHPATLVQLADLPAGDPQFAQRPADRGLALVSRLPAGAPDRCRDDRVQRRLHGVPAGTVRHQATRSGLAGARRVQLRHPRRAGPERLAHRTPAADPAAQPATAHQRGGAHRGIADQGRVPGQDQPRDPHAHERRAGDDRTAPRHPVVGEAARLRADHPQRRQRAAHADQRDPRHLQAGVRADRAGRSAVRPQRADRGLPGYLPGQGRAAAHRADQLHPAAGATGHRRRSDAPAPGGPEPAGQRVQADRGRRDPAGGGPPRAPPCR